MGPTGGSTASERTRGSAVRTIFAIMAAGFPGSLVAAQTPLTPAAVESLADLHLAKAKEAGGAAVIAVVKDGELVFAKGYGRANPKAGTPVDPGTTLFRIGSVTKLFTAITALRLIERGVIDADADVNQYLSKVGVRIHDRFDTPVTMRALLALQAGR